MWIKIPPHVSMFGAAEMGDVCPPPVRSIQGLKRIVAMLSTACRMSSANRQDQDDSNNGSNRGGGAGQEVVGGGGVRGKRRKDFQTTSPAVIDQLMAVWIISRSFVFTWWRVQTRMMITVAMTTKTKTISSSPSPSKLPLPLPLHSL
jgi:hypothetical protein